jgi:hypothetical protein
LAWEREGLSDEWRGCDIQVYIFSMRMYIFGNVCLYCDLNGNCLQYVYDNCVTQIKYIIYNVQDYCVLYKTLLARLYMRLGILLTCRKHLHDCIISVRVDVWAHNISLTPPLFIEVPIPSQKSARSCICVLRVSILSLFKILIIEFEINLTVWYFYFILLRYR